MSGWISTSPPSSPSPALGERDDIDGLETWEDPTPRRSHRTLQELKEAFVAASKAQLSRMPKMPTREERARQVQERERNVLITALNKYAKQNNIQPSDLEFVQVKEASIVHEITREFVHYNFLVLVKGDAEPTMFFAEVKPRCQEEKHVYHCTPLQHSDSGICVACNRGAKELMHPTSGGYLGGHETYAVHMDLVLDSDDDVCYL